MKPITSEKTEKLLAFMEEQGLDLLYIADSENAPDINLQYLSGHPMDATIILTQAGETTLMPRDMRLAKETAEVDRVLNYAEYGYSSVNTLKDFFENILKKPDALIGVTSSISFNTVMEFKQYLPNLRFFEEPIKVTKFLNELRSTKTERELDLLAHAAKIADGTIPTIRKFAEEKNEETEKDLSFLVQRQISKLGAEDIAFPPLVANVTRSDFLHCHPWSTEAVFAIPGFSLIDYGAKYQGYNSDVTMSFTFGELNDHQRLMKRTVERAYEAAIQEIELGVPLWKIHYAADNILKEAGFPLPYALGHGLGLLVHDSPSLGKKPLDEMQKKNWKEVLVEDGQVFTIEPGVYQAGFGGLRIENDFMIRKGKVIPLTHSQIFSFE